MSGKIFTERFCEIKKIKVCTTTAELDFNAYTEPGTYEIYEDMGDGRSRIYFLTVDNSVTGACVKQTRIYCGKVETRQTTTSGTWTAWAAVTGGGSAGASAYDIAVENGFEGSEEEWLVSLKGETGEQGPPGATGATGPQGEPGYSPVRGTDYWTEEDKTEIKSYVDTQLGDIETALDSIIALQNSFIGGGN